MFSGGYKKKPVHGMKQVKTCKFLKENIVQNFLHDLICFQVGGNTIYNMIRFNDLDVDQDDRPFSPPKITKTEVTQEMLVFENQILLSLLFRKSVAYLILFFS